MGVVATDSSDSLELAAAVPLPVNSSLSSLLHYIHTGRHGGGGGAGGGGIAMEEGERGGDRDGERERRGKERENSKTLFYKDCGSVKKPV